MNDQPIASVAIVGSGVAAWYSAAFLSTILSGSVRVEVVETGGGTDPYTGSGSIPPIKAFNARLGISETEFLKATQGTIKLGTDFVNWGQLGNRYFHPFGTYGADFDLVPLHQWWLKQQNGKADFADLETFSMASVMAKEGRFSPPIPDRRMIQSTIDYAYHFDERLYADLVKKRALSNNATSTEGQIRAVHIDEANGFVKSISLVNGTDIAADLFIDASGTEAVLIKGALKQSLEDWSHWLPCNQIVEIACTNTLDILPMSKSIQRSAGWQWRLPLRSRTSHGFVFANHSLPEEVATEMLLENLDGTPIGEPQIQKYQAGVRPQMFYKNVVAVGSAAGWVEPLEATSLHQVQSALNRLAALWPTKSCEEFIAAEFNRVSYQEWCLVRDFLILHYRATTRSDSPLWQSVQSVEAPTSLTERLAHWIQFGRTVSPGPEVFQSESWLSVLLGQGMVPKCWDPLVEARAHKVEYESRLAGLKRVIAETSAQMPSHREWLRLNG
jgi:tryptophan 7-halogenase